MKITIHSETAWVSAGSAPSPIGLPTLHAIWIRGILVSSRDAAGSTLTNPPRGARGVVLQILAHHPIINFAAFSLSPDAIASAAAKTYSGINLDANTSCSEEIYGPYCQLIYTPLVSTSPQCASRLSMLTSDIHVGGVERSASGRCSILPTRLAELLMSDLTSSRT